MSANMIEISSLVFDETIYPRRNVDEMHIRSMMHAMEGGIELPPIVVDRKSKRIVDGVHRYHAALRRGLTKIRGVFKSYADEAELFKDAVQLNSGAGLKLGTDDSLKVIDICARLDIREIDQAAMLRTSVAHIRVIAKRFAHVEGGAKRVPLKASVRHFSGETITVEQEQAMQSAPGNSYLFLTNQFISAFERRLMPLWERHPVLWDRLEVLSDLMLEALKERKKARAA
jgi:hypothetical protein